MDSSSHDKWVGVGSEFFALDQSLEMVDNDYFITDRRMEQLRRMQRAEEDDKHGTVGAVALDGSGNLAAATSTGGMSNKKFGRVGDSPIIGAGTYADNETAAVSATGQIGRAHV